MKILRYEKKKNGMYQIFFDNDNNVDLHEEIILKYQLLLKKEVTNDFINSLLDENKKYIAYDLAIKYISKRMRTKKEIREHLVKNVIDNDTINEVIDLLIKNGYLDDYSYCEAYVNDRMLLSNDGPLKIKDKLLSLGVREESIDKSLKLFSDSIQKERVREIVNKELKINKNKSSVILKNKILQKLYMLGYSKEISMEVVNSTKFDNNKDIYKAQYKKIYDRLSRKYSGKELELRVNQKMYALGFREFEE